MDSLPGQSQVLRFSTLGRIFWGGNWGHISDFSPKIISYLVSAMLNKGIPGGTSGKGPLASTGDIGLMFDPWVGKIPWKSIVAWRILWTEESVRLQD